MCFFFFQAEDGIRDLVRSRGLGDVYKRQFPDYPFLDRMSITFLLIVVVMIVMSFMKKETTHEVQVSKDMFRVTPAFAIYLSLIHISEPTRPY